MTASLSWSLSPPASALLHRELALTQLARLYSCCIPLSFSSSIIKLKTLSGKDLTSLYCFISGMA